MQLPALHIDQDELFCQVALGTSTAMRSRGERLYSQGDDAATVFYVHRGYVKLSVISPHGREAVIGILGRGSFLGHACLSGHPFRESTATPICDCIVTRIDQAEMSRLLDEEPRVRGLFLSYVLGRNVQLETDLADRLFDPCERRLARALLGLAAMEGASGSTPLLSKIDQQTLAGMVGTTQPRISVLLSRFRKKGFVHETGLQVERALMNFVFSTVEAGKGVRANL